MISALTEPGDRNRGMPRYMERLSHPPGQKRPPMPIRKLVAASLVRPATQKITRSRTAPTDRKDWSSPARRTEVRLPGSRLKSAYPGGDLETADVAETMTEAEG